MGRYACCITGADVADLAVLDRKRCKFRPFTGGIAEWGVALRIESSSPELVEACCDGPFSDAGLNKDGRASRVFLV